ncbi:hypothetical protein PENANT_c013G07315 [Penicillium antarcticum]|uniref:Uncharacterized protein n=1 Tax=Penicillium antarcticum TaxID=416450 RepID=A0A1V6Q4R6_9EURO|nr:uncharacterized protein N7508_004269 [Penicillium antarcticum]KAJ5308890.1 hypothetical protein N7508_004269 [Penicillium antarcticum]OQD84240.1 hypothetical protein PENANT_c013G07315 [Penicillium antarcticum]
MSDLQHKLDAVDPDRLDQQQKTQWLQACDKLRTRLESPLATASRLVFSAHQGMAIRLAVDLRLFDVISEQDGVFNVEQLQIEAEPLLVKRILRFLAAMSVIHEVDVDKYTTTPMAAALVTSSPLSAAMIHGTHFWTVLSKLPEYFHSNGWQSPQNGLEGPFQFAHSTPAHYFEFLNSNPYYGQAFNTVMSMPFRRTGKDWFEFFPVASLRVKTLSDPLIVDMGGGQGEDLRKLQFHFPDLPGQLILQDQPGVIAGVDLPGIEVMAHDFFKEQPVRNAKAYFLRTVLHDWPDMQAVQILRRLRPAMGADSLLLISESVLPESGVGLSAVLSDLHMMASYASLERTERQWRSLLEMAGFALVNVWLPNGCESPRDLADQPALFEARLE